MKIAFVWYWDRASEILPNWRDGLRAAVEIIERDHQVDWYLDKKLPNPHDYDFILVWDDSNTRVVDLLGQHDTRMGICLTTDPNNLTNLSNFDVVYCESDPIFEDVRKHGLHAIKAFGTDTNFFTPDDTEKDIEYFYPATFSPWKNQKEIAHLGSKLLCLGTLQPDGQEELDACQANGVQLKVGYYPAEEIRDLYRRSKKVIIPAVHGSERTVLEAKAMGIPIETTASTNSKVLSLLDKDIKDFTSEKYAEALLKGMK